MTEAAFPQIARIGLADFLVRFADRHADAANRAALAFRAALDAAALPGVEETATALVSVHVACDPQAADPPALERRLAELLAARDWLDADLPTGRRRWTIPAAFGGDQGPQLAEAAELAGTDAQQAVETFTADPLRVLTIGFAPGQPYLGTLPAAWDLPRQGGLTPTVPAAAVVVAVRQLVIFTAATPTGWRHVGQTRFPCFRPEAAAPFALTPGDEVQLRPVAAKELDRLAEADPTGLGGATAEPIA